MDRYIRICIYIDIYTYTYISAYIYICVEKCAVAYLCGVWHDSCICVMWWRDSCIRAGHEMTHSYVWFGDVTHSYVWCEDSAVACLFGVTHSYVWYGAVYVWHDTCMCVIWLIHACGMTQSRVWHDSLSSLNVRRPVDTLVAFHWAGHVCKYK